MKPYSAAVDLKLVADGRTFELSQIGPGFARFAWFAIPVLPVCDAEITSTVDGKSSFTRYVRLPQGSDGQSKEIVHEARLR